MSNVKGALLRGGQSALEWYNDAMMRRRRLSLFQSVLIRPSREPWRTSSRGLATDCCTPARRPSSAPGRQRSGSAVDIP
jgi:hypothetical protein